MKKLLSLIGVGLAFAWSENVWAGDDILAEAKYYWRFDEDVNGNGKLDADDIRDVRKWGTKAASADTLKISDIKGNDIQANGPEWVDTLVRQPARGLRYPGKALRFTVDNRATETWNETWKVMETNCCPVGFTFANAAITGSVSVVWRCRVDSFKSYDGCTDHAWLVNNGENWATVAGSNFGFRPVSQTGAATTGRPAVYFGRSELYSNMVLETNVWYDVGISLKDTGDGGAKGIIVVCDSGNDKAYGALKDQPWKPKFQQVENLSLAAGSGAFTNEAKHASYIKIGGENPGNRAFRSANKGFAGDLQRVVMWDRALTETELLAAIRQPAQLFKVGLEDGKSGEFGDRGDLTETYHAGLPETPWHYLPKSVDATNPGLTMTVLATNDHAKLWQILRVKAAEGAAGVTRLQPTINGTTLEPQDLAPLGEALWFVKPQTLVAGTNNTITLQRLAVGSTAESLAFDLIEMCGTWEIGVNDDKNDEFSVENVGPNPCTAYPGSYACGNVQRGIPTSVPDLTLKFYMPQNLLDYDYVFKTRAIAQGASNADRYVSDGKVKVKNQYPFKISLNGSEIYSTEGVANNTEIIVKIPAGSMTNGWNTILLSDRGGGYKYPETENSWNNYWVCWDYHALEVQRPPRGMMLLLR